MCCELRLATRCEQGLTVHSTLGYYRWYWCEMSTMVQILWWTWDWNHGMGGANCTLLAFLLWNLIDLCESLFTTLLMLCMDFHIDAKSELRIGYWKLSFCQGLYSWYGWYQWYPSGFSTMNAHWLMCKPMHSTWLKLHVHRFPHDAKSELRRGN